MMELKFRKASTHDVGLIAQLADSIWRKHYITIITIEQIEFMLATMYSAESLLKQMNEGHVFTIIYDNEKAIGYISLSTKDEWNYFLHKFYVDNNEQGKGIGSKLLEYILKELANAESIELTVNRKNYKAINFYFKNGFVIKDVADFDIGNGYFMNDFV
ncbi:MAG: GNAT family N-acetyltransferase, partial [Bacteroidetes bacterium]|nr:GNAT family N-acetyltransferase [Bacteroidota bacterium]